MLSTNLLAQESGDAMIAARFCCIGNLRQYPPSQSDRDARSSFPSFARRGDGPGSLVEDTERESEPASIAGPADHRHVKSGGRARVVRRPCLADAKVRLARV